jgi:aerobic-type carbon monoxide dehydrogenase small subunit (CoxS/CutS family)
MTAVNMTVNEKTVSADVEDRILLVELLRDTFGLTGTHVRHLAVRRMRGAGRWCSCQIMHDACRPGGWRRGDDHRRAR